VQADLRRLNIIRRTREAHRADAGSVGATTRRNPGQRMQKKVEEAMAGIVTKLG
jgi:hypothetical protein